MSLEIKKLKREIRLLKEIAYKDELTKLYNRRGFKAETEKFIHEVILHKKRSEMRKSFLIKNFSLILFDIDNFKHLNDSHGHSAGDAALKFLAELILKRVRDIDIVARWGGEEIIIGLVGADENDAYKIADGIRKKLAGEKMGFHKQKISFSISGGVSSFDGAEDFDHLFKNADEALYKAKKLGKNRIIKYIEKT